MNFFTDSDQNQKYIAVSNDAEKYPFNQVTFFYRTKFNQRFDDKIYVREEEFQNYLYQYINFSNQHSNSRIEALSKNIIEMKRSFSISGISESNLNLVNHFIQEIHELSSTNAYSELFKLLNQSSQVDRSLYFAIISKLLLQELGWNSPLNFKKMIMVSLFCDLGDADSSLTEQEKILASISLLEKNKYIHSDVILAVRHHHEYLDGSGPFGIEKHYIHPYGKIISMCHDFYSYFNNKQIKQGLNFLLINPHKYDRALVKALVKTFIDNN